MHSGQCRSRGLIGRLPPSEPSAACTAFCETPSGTAKRGARSFMDQRVTQGCGHWIRAGTDLPRAKAKGHICFANRAGKCVPIDRECSKAGGLQPVRPRDQRQGCDHGDSRDEDNDQHDIEPRDAVRSHGRHVARQAFSARSPAPPTLALTSRDDRSGSAPGCCSRAVAGLMRQLVLRRLLQRVAA